MDVDEHRYLERLLATSVALALARDFALRFAAIVREQKVDELGHWWTDATESELRSFAEGLKQHGAVGVALQLL